MIKMVLVLMLSGLASAVRVPPMSLPLSDRILTRLSSFEMVLYSVKVRRTPRLLLK